MKKIIYVLVATVLLVSCKPKADKKTTVKKEIEEVVQTASAEEWSILFDGTSFDKWRGYLTKEMPSEWIIEDGAMAFIPGEGGANIITKEKFKNFELSIEWKISEGGNSGIFWSVFEDEKFQEAYQTGPEIQVIDNAKYPVKEGSPKYHQAGALYDMVEPSHEVSKPAGEWNSTLLKVNHNTNEGSVTLNGTIIVVFPVHGSGWDSMVENSKFKGWDGFGKYQNGHIGLQDHGGKVWYRNIKIKEL